MPKQTFSLPAEKTNAALRDEFWSAHPDAHLSRKVTAAGLGISVGYLEAKALSGDGPVYMKSGRRVLYPKRDSLAWYESKAQRVTSTSQYVPINKKTPS